MTKISALPPDTAPTMTDDFATRDVESNTTKRTLLSAVRDLFFTQTNIPAGGGSPVTRAAEGAFDYIASGGVWSADSVGVNRNASMTAMICYINGRRISISAVTARTFTASKDTYIDVLDNGDGTGTLVYTEAVNNAASSSLAANSLRIGIIVTGATTIAATGSINQGQEDKVLPIASSIPYAVTDSIGNLICPRDSTRQLLGYRRITSNATNGGVYAQITGLTVPVIVPANRKIFAYLYCSKLSNTLAGASNTNIGIWDGSVAAGTQIAQGSHTSAGANYGATTIAEALATPTTTSKTYNAGLNQVGGTTGTAEANTSWPMYLKIELR